MSATNPNSAGLSVQVPAYAEQVALVEQSRRTTRKRESGEVLTLLHFSDPHGDAECVKRIVAWASANSELIDDIVCTGDLVCNNYEEGLAYWEEIPGAERVLTCIGNHDVQPSASDKTHYGISVAQAAERYIDAFAPNWGSIIHTEGSTWYAKDYPTPAMRFIMLDTLIYDAAEPKSEAEAQLSWLKQRLNEARENEFAVIIGEHFPIAEANMVDSSWQPFDGRFVYGPFMDTRVADCVQEFIDAGGTFVCYLCGHCHTDGMHTLPGHPEQFACAIPSATDDEKQDVWGDVPRSTSGSQDCFNVFTVDRQNGLVKFVRVGANRDLALQHRGVFTWDYVNHRLVYAD